MNELDQILKTHIGKVEQRFKTIPKSNKHKGPLAQIQNKLESTEIFAKQAEKIVNEELKTMLKHVNSNLVDKLPQKDIDNFVDKARMQFREVMTKGLKDSLK